MSISSILVMLVLLELTNKDRYVFQWDQTNVNWHEDY